jgi:hypothetical protein
MLITKRHGTRFKTFRENTDFLRMPSPHRIKNVTTQMWGNICSSVAYVWHLSPCLLFACLSWSIWNNRCTIKKAFRPKKKGFFTEILKMSSSVSESEVMTFITSRIGKMNSYHILTHYLVISNLILSYNLYSSCIFCSLMALQPIFRNASRA